MKKYIVLLGLTLAMGLFIANTTNAQVIWTPDGNWQSTVSNLSSDGFIRAKGRMVSPVIRPFVNATGAYETRFDLGYASNEGAGLEMYRNSDANRAGEFRFVYGGAAGVGSVLFMHSTGSTFTPKMTLDKSGNLDILDGQLRVNGKITSKEVEVKLDVWSDFVFYKDYNLMPLNEVEQFIDENGHLPSVPNEAQVKENGINVGQMNAVLLQKIEELTLYIIDLNKRIAELEK